MGDRRKLKAKMTDVAPAELPEDIPNNCKYKMTWRDSENNKFVLLEVTDQGKIGTCWTIALSRMIAAHLYIHDRVRLLYSFSAKHLFGSIKEKSSKGFLKNYKGVKTFLKEEGLILERDCKCVFDKNNITNVFTDACNKVKGINVFKIRELIIVEQNKIDEKQIINLLNTRGPIVAEIVASDTYKNTLKDEVYFGPKDSDKNKENHLILLTGYDTKDGVHYFEFQNTWGRNWGSGGFGKFARKISLPKGNPSLIMAYMYPELLDQVFDMQV